MKYLYLSLGYISLILGIAGTILPVLPTTPFILLATYFFSKSSKKLHQWLKNHRIFGRMINDWNRHRAISLKAKILSTVMIVSLFSYTIFFKNYHNSIKLLLLSIAFGVLAFILSRPLPPQIPIDKNLK